MYISKNMGLRILSILSMPWSPHLHTFLSCAGDGKKHGKQKINLGYVGYAQLLKLYFGDTIHNIFQCSENIQMIKKGTVLKVIYYFFLQDVRRKQSFA